MSPIGFFRKKGNTISQPEKCIGNTQNNSVFVYKLMHTFLKWFGYRIGVCLGLGFVWSTKVKR